MYSRRQHEYAARTDSIFVELFMDLKNNDSGSTHLQDGGGDAPGSTHEFASTKARARRNQVRGGTVCVPRLVAARSTCTRVWGAILGRHAPQSRPRGSCSVVANMVCVSNHLRWHLCRSMLAAVRCSTRLEYVPPNLHWAEAIIFYVLSVPKAPHCSCARPPSFAPLVRRGGRLCRFGTRNVTVTPHARSLINRDLSFFFWAVELHSISPQSSEENLPLSSTQFQQFVRNCDPPGLPHYAQKRIMLQLSLHVALMCMSVLHHISERKSYSHRCMRNKIFFIIKFFFTVPTHKSNLFHSRQSFSQFPNLIHTCLTSTIIFTVCTSCSQCRYLSHT